MKKSDINILDGKRNDEYYTFGHLWNYRAFGLIIIWDYVGKVSYMAASAEVYAEKMFNPIQADIW